MSFIWSAPVSEAQIHQQVTAELNDAALNQIRDSINSETADRTLADFFINANITVLSDTVTAEINARVASDTYLLEKIELEEIARANAALALADDLNAEITNRTNAEFQLQSDFQTALDNEKTARAQADAALTANFTAAIESETNRANAAIANLRAQIQSETALLSSDTGSISAALTAEANTRATNDDNLSAAIEAERKARADADANYFASATTLVTSEVAFRRDADTALDTALTAEIQSRISEDGKLTAAINAEKTDRTNADNALTSNFTAAINAEKTARETADAELQSSLTRTLTTYAPINNPTFTGVVKVPAITAGSTGEAAANKSYVDSAVANVTVSVFTSPTATTDGTAGLLPAPKATNKIEVMTNLGWRALDDTSLTIGTVPSQAAALTYNRAAQSPTWLNYDASKMVITGETSGTDARTYTAKVKPIDLYLWADTKAQEERTITWKIDALKLAKPTASVTDFTYNRSQQGVTVSNFDSTYMTQSGSTTATAAASYSAVYALKSKTNTTWSDGSTDNVTIPWKINVLKIAKPAAATTEFVYDGDSKTLSVTNFNNVYMSETGTKSAVSVGNYSIVYALLDAANVHWADNSVADVAIAWKIIKRELSAELSTGFAQSGEQTYTGSEITVAVTNFNPEYHVLGGDFKKTNAGTYTASVAPAGSYVWSDGSTTPKTFSWTIDKAKIDKPAASTTSFNYTGATITFVPTHAPDSNSVFVISSDSTKSAALIDNYAVKYNLRDTANYTWADGTSGVVMLNWSIVANKLSADLSSGFAQVTPLTYNGANQTVTISHTSATYHTITGNVQSDAGTYTATITPVYGYAWNDGSTAAKSVSWKIAPVEVSIPWLDGSDYEYTGSAINAANDLQDYNANYVQLSGDLAKTEPQTYSITAALKNKNYVWGASATFPDVPVNDTADKTVSWRIRGKPIAEPTFASDAEFTYSGAQKSVTVNGFQSTYMESTGTLTATDAGTYTITYTLKDTVATRWANGTEGAVVLTWKINRQNLSSALSTFAVSGDYYYNGSDQTVAISGYNAAYHDISGNTAKLPGSYTATISPKANYAWSDGTTTSKSVPWTLNKAVVRLNNTPAAFETINGVKYLVWRPSYTYDENTTHNVGNFSVTAVKGAVSGTWNLESGTSSAQNVGNYQCVLNGNVYNYATTPVSGSVFTLTPQYAAVDWTISGSSDSAEKLLIVWTINRKKLTAAQSTFSDVSYTYDGAAKTNPFPNFDANYHGINYANGYYNQHVNAGTYTHTISVGGNYAWSDGSTANKTATITINAAKVTKPTPKQTEFVYSGSAVNFLASYVNNYDSATMNVSGKTSETIPGDYSTTFALKNGNYHWADDSTGNLQLNWKISAYPIPRANSENFAQATSLTYSGSEQTVTISGVDTAHSTIGGTVRATNAGEYSATVTPNQYCTWYDGTTAAKSVSWKISPIKLTKPTCNSSSTIQWTGSEINWLADYIRNYDSATMTVSGTYAATTLGARTFTIAPKTNYGWSDGTTDAVSFTWEIVKKVLTGGDNGPFEVTNGDVNGNTFYYINATQAVTVANFNPAYHKLYKAASGGTGYTEAQSVSSAVGTYTWGVEPNSNCTWSDGTTARKTFEIVVAKAPLKVVWLDGYDSVDQYGRVTVKMTDADYRSLETDGLRRLVNFKLVDHRGETVSTSKAGVLSTVCSWYSTTFDDVCEISGTKLYLYGHESRDYDICLTAAASDYYQAIGAWDNQILLSVDRSLATIPTWARIKELSDAGKLGSYEEGGTVNSVGHTRSAAGSPNSDYPLIFLGLIWLGNILRSAWMYAKRSGQTGHVAFTDSKYGQTVSSGDYYAHNCTTGTTVSWATSNLRAKCTSFYNNGFGSVKDYITPRTIDGGTDYVWLLNEVDMNALDYFANANCTPFHGSSGNEVKIWTRLITNGGATADALTFTGNGYTGEEVDPHTSLGFVPCFLI